MIGKPHGPLTDLVHVRKDASRHPEQEVFHLVGVGHQPFPLLCQRADDLALLLWLQVKDHVLCGLPFSKLRVPGIRPVIAMERFGDGGGDQEHSVHVTAALTEGFAGDKALCDGFAFFVPFEVHIQIDPLTAAIVSRTEDVRALGDLPAIVPHGIQQEVFVGQEAYAVQPVLQLRIHLLGGALPFILHFSGILRRGFPTL